MEWLLALGAAFHPRAIVYLAGLVWIVLAYGGALYCAVRVFDRLKSPAPAAAFLHRGGGHALDVAPPAAWRGDHTDRQDADGQPADPRSLRDLHCLGDGLTSSRCWLTGRPSSRPAIFCACWVTASWGPA